MKLKRQTNFKTSSLISKYSDIMMTKYTTTRTTAINIQVVGKWEHVNIDSFSCIKTQLLSIVENIVKPVSNMCNFLNKLLEYMSQCAWCLLKSILVVVNGDQNHNLGFPHNFHSDASGCLISRKRQFGYPAVSSTISFIKISADWLYRPTKLIQSPTADQPVKTNSKSAD